MGGQKLRCMMLAAAAFAASVWVQAPAHAAVIFSDNFDTDSAVTVLNFNAFNNWTVVNHPTETVDYIRSGGFRDQLCRRHRRLRRSRRQHGQRGPHGLEHDLRLRSRRRLHAQRAGLRQPAGWRRRCVRNGRRRSRQRSFVPESPRRIRSPPARSRLCRRFRLAVDSSSRTAIPAATTSVRSSTTWC
jgi:hypothetical protein